MSLVLNINEFISKTDVFVVSTRDDRILYVSIL